MDANKAQALWDWYQAGGYEAVAAWLWARDVSRFNPGAAPILTEAKAIMMQAGLSLAEAWLVEQMQGRLGPFARGVVGAPWQSLCERLSVSAPNGVKLVVPALFHAFREAGWRDLGRIYSAEYQTKTHAFAAPDWDGTKSEARRIIAMPEPSAAEIIARVKG